MADEPGFSDHLTAVESHVAEVASSAPEGVSGENKAWQMMTQLALSILKVAAARHAPTAPAAAPAPGGYVEVTREDLADVTGVTKTAAQHILDELGPIYMAASSEASEDNE